MNSEHAVPMLAVVLVVALGCGASTSTGGTAGPVEPAVSSDTVATTSAGERSSDDADPVVSPLDVGRGWLGIVLDPIDLKAAITMGFDRPLVGVERVFPGSPAASSGFLEGDLVLRFDGEPLLSTDQVIAWVGGTAPGTVVVFTLERNGRQFDQPVMLGLRPELDELVRSVLVGRPAPPLAVTDIATGEPFTLTDRSGEIVVIDFWATWCWPCRRVMPEIDALAQRYIDRGVSVVGVSNEALDVLDRFVAEQPVSYVIGADIDGATTSNYFISAYPTLLLIDRSGVVREVFIGGTEIPNLEAHLLELLEE